MNRSVKNRLAWLCLAVPLMLGACSRVELDDPDVSGQTGELSVTTRSGSDAAISYPVSVFAFDGDGKLQARQTLESSSQPVSLRLPEGPCYLLALSGYAAYDVPEEPTYESLIGMPSGNCYSSSPLLLGTAAVTVTGSTQQVNIQMAYAVSRFCVNLTQVPEEVTRIDVTLSNVYTACSFAGQPAQSGKAEIACTKNGSTWTTGTCYVFGTGTANLAMSISLTAADQTRTYGFTCSTPLTPGVPYLLNGSYADDLSLTGTLSAGRWDDEVVANFTFGPGATTQETVTVTEIPAALDIWNGHVVALVENATGTEADLLLLSLQEWEGMTSAYYTADPQLPVRTCEAYTEGKLTGWRMPLREEALSLKAAYSGESLTALNEVLNRAGGSAVTDTEANGSNARYLCEAGTYSFVFKSGTSVTATGATVKTYRLRPVCRVHVSL